MEINIDLRNGDAKGIDAIRKLIEARRKELGETARQACVAITQNILRSLRAQTVTAKPGDPKISITNMDSQYFPSWKRNKGVKGKNPKRTKRVLRQGGPQGKSITKKVIWLNGRYRKNEELHTYKVVDSSIPTKPLEYLVVAKNESKAMSYAKKFHKAKVNQHKGLAKAALGMVMYQLFGTSTGTMTQKVSGLAKTNVETSIKETGFNSGDVSIHAADKLDYAVNALRSQTAINTAIENAVNKMWGYIKNKVKQNGGSITEPIPLNAKEMLEATRV